MKTGRDIKFDKRKLFSGAVLIVLGILSPAALTVSTFKIPELINRAVVEYQTGYLMEAGLLLVLLNTIRSLPHYLGTFLILQSVTLKKPAAQFFKNIVLSLLIISGVYFAIEIIYGIRYDFAIPAMLMITAILAVDRIELSLVSIEKKILMMMMLIFCIQFLDIMPGLSSSFFGRGEISYDIKIAADFLDAIPLMRGFCFVFMGIFAFSAVTLGLQITLENKLRKSEQQSKEDQEQLTEARLRLLEARINKEQQFLVHDLKAPLTSIQIWSDLLQMKSEDCGSGDCKSYISHINGSIAHMNMLISEIMSSKTRNVFTAQDVIKLFSSQTSPAYYSPMVRIECSCPDVKMEMNRTNFVRALINLTDNSARSIHGDDGEIILSVSASGGNVSFCVSDNGEGIEQEFLDRMWEKGVSGRNSSGVGLFFVREVVEELGGSVSIESTPGLGTSITLAIPSVHDED